MSQQPTGSQSGSGNQGVSIPKWLRPYYKNTAAGLEAAQGSLPSIMDLYNSYPLLNTPNLTADQNKYLSEIEGIDPNNASTQAAQAGLTGFTSAKYGTPSQATTAALNEFSDLQSPLIMQNAALMGQGTSGAALSALAQGQEAATVPFMQTDLTNQLTASQDLGILGSNQFTNQETAGQNAYTAASQPYDVTAQQNKDLYNQQYGKSQYASGIQTGGQSQFPSLLGSWSNSIGGTSAPKF